MGRQIVNICKDKSEIIKTYTHSLCLLQMDFPSLDPTHASLTHVVQVRL